MKQPSQSLVGGGWIWFHLMQTLITSVRPNEGDWIYMPTVQRLFEISFVDVDDPFFQDR